jgi:hypothetical protein
MRASVVSCSEFLATDTEVPGSISGAARFFLEAVGSARGPHSLVTTTDELLGRIFFYWIYNQQAELVIL